MNENFHSGRTLYGFHSEVQVSKFLEKVCDFSKSLGLLGTKVLICTDLEIIKRKRISFVIVLFILITF